MALKTYNPRTSSIRSLVTVDKSELWKGRPEKKLISGLKKTGGRNNRGRMTVRHRGGLPANRGPGTVTPALA